MKLAIALLYAASQLSAATCGIPPIKPVTPIGCKDLRPECVCDEKGQNCGWRWICQK